MKPVQVLAHLWRARFDVAVEGRDLVITPAERLMEPWPAAIVANKPGIMRLLTSAGVAELKGRLNRGALMLFDMEERGCQDTDSYDQALGLFADLLGAYMLATDIVPET